jgi:hypothetical protein
MIKIGARGLLNKPYYMREMLRVVRKALDEDWQAPRLSTPIFSSRISFSHRHPILAKENSTFSAEVPKEMIIDLSHGEDGKGWKRFSCRWSSS